MVGGEAFWHDHAGRCATEWLVEGRMKGGVYQRRLGGGGEGQREEGGGGVGEEEGRNEF